MSSLVPLERVYIEHGVLPGKTGCLERVPDLVSLCFVEGVMILMVLSPWMERLVIWTETLASLSF